MPIPVGAWVFIDLDDRYLAYTYADRTHGLSAKGSPVGNPPDPAAVQAAVQSPRATVRLVQGGFTVTPLTPAERESLGLSGPPAWVAMFEPADGSWRSDPALAKYLHPSYPDDLQARFYFTVQRRIEDMWVRLAQPDPEIGGYRGSLLNEPNTKTGLSAGSPVSVRVAPGAPIPVALDPTMRANLLQWQGACSECGFDMILEPVDELAARQFPGTPPAELQIFTTRCALCRGTMTVQRHGKA